MRFNSERLNEIADSVGLEEVGVVSAEPLGYMLDRLERRGIEGRVTPFEEEDPAKRISPGHLLPGCRSIITLTVPYSLPQKDEVDLNCGPRGKVARCAQGIDYHNIVEKKAEDLAMEVKKESGAAFNYRVLSDRSPLIERELARKSGLGVIGENCTLIDKKYGSFVAIGTILVDKEFEPSPPADEPCRKCGKCREACPTGALTEPYIINPLRCISYLSQAGGVFPREFRTALGDRIYGCDICQEVCPHNDQVPPAPYREFAFPFFPAEPSLIPLLHLTRREYDLTINLTSAGWRGKTTLQRNIILALGDSGNRDVVPHLTRILENDPRHLIRLHSAWSLGRLGGPKAHFALQKSAEKDPEPAVREESLLALETKM